MLELNNPASRLLAFLKVGRSINQSDRIPIKTAWRQILEVPEGDETMLLRRIGLVYVIPAEIQDGVLALENENHELLLQPLTEINAALSVSLHQPWQKFMGAIGETSMYGLKVVEDRLERSSMYPALDEGALQSMQDQIAELLEEVLRSSVASELRELLVRHLQQMLSAVVEVRLRGADALRDVGEAALGGAIVYDRLHSSAEDGDPSTTAERRRFLKGMVGCAAGLLVLVNTSKGALELEAKVNERFFEDQKALEPGQP